jgi:hypothetical protein
VPGMWGLSCEGALVGCVRGCGTQAEWRGMHGGQTGSASLLASQNGQCGQRTPLRWL